MTSQKGNLFVLKGLIWLEAGDHHFSVKSQGIYYTLTVAGQHQQNLGPNPVEENYTSMLSVSQPGMYPVEISALVVDQVIPLKMEVRLNDEVLDVPRLFNDHQLSAAIHLPDDLEPLSGFPDAGYILYSPARKELFYRQPLSDSREGLIKIPGQYVGRMDSNPDQLQGRFQSTTGTIFQLTIESSEGVFKPRMSPLQFNWNRHNYQAAVEETLYFPPVSDLIPATVTMEGHSEQGHDEPCGFGFYDPQGIGGKGQILLMDRDFRTLYVAPPRILSDSGPFPGGQLSSAT